MAKKLTVKDWEEKDKLILIKGWTRDGASMDDIAERMGIARSTLYEWANKSAEISDALKKGREVVDKEVESALLKKALGYTVDEITEEQDADGNVYSRKVTKRVIPPDTASMIFWLSNRMSDIWKNRRESTVDIKERKAAAEEIKALAERLNDTE